MLEYQNLSPGTRERIEKLAEDKQCSLEEALEEIVIESIAMGGLTLAARPKATLTSIKGGPKGDHLNRTSTTDPL